MAQGVSNDLTMNQSTSTDELSIQDLLFVENRDRQYDPNVVDLKGNYTISDLDFNLSQFGLMVNSNILYINFHINKMIESIGRKLMPGDVLEIEHRKEDVVLDPGVPVINAFYVIKDASRAAEGYSPTWQAHIWRCRAEPLTDSQEFKEILNQVTGNGQSLADIISNASKTLALSNAIQAEGNNEVPTRNFNSDNLYVDPNGNPIPGNNLIPWLFNGDGTPPNQNMVAPSGTRWPESPMVGDYFLRTDYHPARLFQRHTTAWCAVSENWRDRAWTPAHRKLEDQLENQAITTMPDGDSFTSNQPIYDVIKPRQPLPVVNPLMPGED